MKCGSGWGRFWWGLWRGGCECVVDACVNERMDGWMDECFGCVRMMRVRMRVCDVMDVCV